MSDLIQVAWPGLLKRKLIQVQSACIHSLSYCPTLRWPSPLSTGAPTSMQRVSWQRHMYSFLSALSWACYMPGHFLTTPGNAICWYLSVFAKWKSGNGKEWSMGLKGRIQLVICVIGQSEAWSPSERELQPPRWSNNVPVSLSKRNLGHAIECYDTSMQWHVILGGSQAVAWPMHMRAFWMCLQIKLGQRPSCWPCTMATKQQWISCSDYIGSAPRMGWTVLTCQSSRRLAGAMRQPLECEQ